MPDAQWAKRVSVDVPIGLDSTPVAQNSRLLVWLVRLVISVEWNGQQLFVLTALSDKHGPRISNVCAKDFGADDENGDAG